MILLLDAHALIWWFQEDGGLRQEAADAIRSPLNDVLVSAATVWEIELKRARHVLEVPDNVLEASEAAGFSLLPVTAVDGVRAARLPRHHGDPFDRMLVAQAMRLDAVLVTRDPAFGAYGIPLLAA